MTKRFENKVVVITGGSDGIGLTTAKLSPAKAPLYTSRVGGRSFLIKLWPKSETEPSAFREMLPIAQMWLDFTSGSRPITVG